MGSKIRVQRSNSRPRTPAAQSPQANGEAIRALRSYNPEALLISALLTTGDHFIPADQGVTVEHFVSFSAEYEWLDDYFTRHTTSPSLAAFLGAFPRFKYVETDETAYATEAVIRAWARRRMASSVRQAADLLKQRDEAGAVQLVLAQAAAVENAMSPAGRARSSITQATDTYEEVSRVFERVAQHGAAGIATGCPTIDDRTGGLGDGQLWIPAARTGHGKSWLMLRWAAEAVMAGRTVHFWSMEMPRAQVDIRFHMILSQLLDGNKSDLTATGLEYGTGSLMDYRRLLDKIRAQVPGNMFVRTPGRSPVRPRNINAALERDGADLVFVDYLQLLEPDDVYAERGWQSIGSIGRGLKAIAMANMVPVVAASQINRDGATGKRPPRLENLSQADSLAHDADVVFTLKQQSQSTIEGFMAKLRGGTKHWATHFRFLPDTGDIEEVSAAEAEELRDEDYIDDE